MSVVFHAEHGPSNSKAKKIRVVIQGSTPEKHGEAQSESVHFCCSKVPALLCLTPLARWLCRLFAFSRERAGRIAFDSGCKSRLHRLSSPRRPACVLFLSDSFPCL